MEVSLKPELQNRIDEKLRAGEFESPEALVEQALTFFLDYADEEMTDAEIRDTQAAIAEGFDQLNRGESISLEEFDRTMRAKYGLSR
jgi:Arc/MetJ-type ribon-helix-helix transcriptional regulator